jgi:hypothetical protein
MMIRVFPACYNEKKPMRARRPCARFGDKGRRGDVLQQFLAGRFFEFQAARRLKVQVQGFIDSSGNGVAS